MASDARIAVSLPAHPKTRKLIKRLGDGAAWNLVRLFLWASENKPDGDLDGMSVEDIELAVDWSGEDGLFATTLADIGFLDVENGTYSIHDWDQHNPWASGFHMRSAKARWNAIKRHEGVNAANRKVPEWATRNDATSNATSTNVADGQHATSNAPSPSPSPSPSPKQEQKQKHVQQAAMVLDRFPEFWAVYPRHIARKAAAKAWLAAKPDDAMADRIIAAVRAQTPGFLRRDKDKIPHAATWLNAERWNDEVEVMRTGPPTNGTMSKALSGIQKLQAMRINEREQPRLATERDPQRAIEVDDPEPRPPARCGPD